MRLASGGRATGPAGGLVPELSTEDRAFLSGYDASQFPRPSLAVDVVWMTADEGALWVAVTRRTEPPFRGLRALPGAFVRPEEPLEDAVARALRKVGDTVPRHVEQLYTFGDPGRDPRGRVVSVAWFALVPPAEMPAGGERVRLGADGSPREELAFDHARICALAVQRLRGKVGWTDVAFGLLPDEFTLRQLQAVHETILGRKLNKDSFRRTALAAGLVEGTGAREEAVGHRPAELFRLAARPGG